MISTSKILIKNRFQLVGLLFLSIFIFSAQQANAQSALSLSVSPTIFDMSANPAQEWTSFVRVINPNPYEIKVFANVVNFAPQGESGQGKFVPLIEEESNGQTIAEWIDVTSEEILIPAEQTLEVPFSVTVPDNAPPGGHFAALLIGTKPPKDDKQTQVVTSQIVTTLLFLRITGDIDESGTIRSFRTTKKILEQPQATFELRFENTGNVHILPQGEIRITNMWGQERGIIPINRSSLYGNVLPESVRKYDFTWTGEWSVSDIGRYTAIASLAYGDEGRKFASSEVSFWVIPWKILLLVILILAGFGMMFTWAVKLYIRKMLMIAGVSNGASRNPVASIKSTRRVSVVAPIEEGMLDLREQWQETSNFKERVSTLTAFFNAYRIFFGVIFLVAIFIILVFAYVQSASVSERAYNVTIDGLSEEVKISSEDVKYQELKEQSAQGVTNDTDNSLPKIRIVNRSGVAGLAADLRFQLETEGYEVTGIENDLGSSDKNTVIVYDPELSDEALALSQLIYGALLSAFVDETQDETSITIYVGEDLKNAVQ